jgi:hypothetical protein
MFVLIPFGGRTRRFHTKEAKEEKPAQLPGDLCDLL